MKTVYARVSEVSGKVLISNKATGAKLTCSDDDFLTIHRFGYIASVNEICFSGDFTIENSVLTLNKSTDLSEF